MSKYGILYAFSTHILATLQCVIYTYIHIILCIASIGLSISNSDRSPAYTFLLSATVHYNCEMVELYVLIYIIVYGRKLRREYKLVPIRLKKHMDLEGVHTCTQVAPRYIMTL